MTVTSSPPLTPRSPEEAEMGFTPQERTENHRNYLDRIKAASAELGDIVIKLGALGANLLCKDDLILPVVSTIAANPVARVAANVTALVRMPTAVNKSSIFGPTANKILCSLTYLAFATNVYLYISGNDEECLENNNQLLAGYVGAELTAQAIDLAGRAIHSVAVKRAASPLVRYFAGKQD